MTLIVGQRQRLSRWLLDGFEFQIPHQLVGNIAARQDNLRLAIAYQEVTPARITIRNTSRHSHHRATISISKGRRRE